MCETIQNHSISEYLNKKLGLGIAFGNASLRHAREKSIINLGMRLNLSLKLD